MISKFNFDNADTIQPYLINSFEKIGLVDCFPNDKDTCRLARMKDLKLNDEIIHDPLYTYLYP